MSQKTDVTRVLVVTAVEERVAAVTRALERAGRRVVAQQAQTAEQLDGALSGSGWDLVTSDAGTMPPSPLDVLAALQRRHLDTPCFVLTTAAGESAAAEVMHAGARDFFRVADLSRLAPALERERRVADARMRIAHDFNNPLTAILGFTGLALERHAAGRVVLTELQQVKEAAERGLRFTSDLLSRRKVTGSDADANDARLRQGSGGQGRAASTHDPGTQHPEPRAPSTEHPITIIVADDDPAVRAFIHTVLTDAGFSVIDAGGGPDAAALVARLSHPPDLLIADVVMSGMLGPDVARALRQRFPNSRVLFITSFVTRDGASPEFVMADDALLQKPFLRAQLLACVRERLGQAT